jgi:hypothetical protein
VNNKKSFDRDNVVEAKKLGVQKDIENKLSYKPIMAPKTKDFLKKGEQISRRESAILSQRSDSKKRS